MLRSIAAVVAGFVLWTLLWLISNQALMVVASEHFGPEGATDHPGVLSIVLALSVVFSVLAGWLSATIAQRPAAALAVGLLLLAVGIFVQSQYWQLMPLWYHLIFLALLLPAALLGGRIRASRRS